MSTTILIRNFRQKKGLSQAQLAERVGVDQSQISRMENGDVSPTLKTLGKIADVLGVKTARLINN